MSSQTCIFCRIHKGEIPSTRVFDDENWFGIRDIQPQAIKHFLLIPKVHYASLAVADGAILEEGLVMAVRAAKALGLADAGFRVVINTGKEGGQTVDHLHLHLLGGEQLGGGFGRK